MSITKEQIIGELVAKDYRTASVFKEYGIDFCCNGNRTIAQACEKASIDSNLLVDKLQKVQLPNDSGAIPFNSWDIDLLADYIEKKHHRYVEQRSQEILPYLDKICRVHGAHHPELYDINILFLGAVEELTAHMKKEELILFPFARKIAKAFQNGTKADKPHFGSVQNPIQVMMNEHSNEGDRFRKIAELSNNYTPPQDACNTYRVTFALLNEFEQDLHLHIHLENNILFPKAIELEKEVL